MILWGNSIEAVRVVNHSCQYILTHATLQKHVHVHSCMLTFTHCCALTLKQTSQLSPHTLSDIHTFSMCSLNVISTQMQHIRQTPPVNISNLFPTQKPNICSYSDMGLNEGTTFQQSLLALRLFHFHTLPFLPVGIYSLLRPCLDRH